MMNRNKKRITGGILLAYTSMCFFNFLSLPSLYAIDASTNNPLVIGNSGIKSVVTNTTTGITSGTVGDTIIRTTSTSSSGSIPQNPSVIPKTTTPIPTTTVIKSSTGITATGSLSNTASGVVVKSSTGSTTNPTNSSIVPPVAYSQCTLTLDKASYNAGDLAVLSWTGVIGPTAEFSFANRVFNNVLNLGKVTISSGSVSFKMPDASSYFGLTIFSYNSNGASNGNCSATAKVVLPTPPIIVNVDKTLVSASQPTATISWVATGAMNVQVSGITSTSAVFYTQTGSVRVTPVVSSIPSQYTIRAQWANGTSNSKTITIAYQLGGNAFSGKTSGPVVYGANTPNMLAYRLGVVINENDPLSVQIGNYYAQAHSINSANVFKIKLPYGTGITNVSTGAFTDAYKTLLSQIGTKDIQMLALTWAAPYKVNNCVSITSAFAFGYTGSIDCNTIQFKENPLYDSVSITPYTTSKVRPTMAVAALTFDQAKKLIDRGVIAQKTKVSNYNPNISAYLVYTTDSVRSTRNIADSWTTFAPWLARYMPTYHKGINTLTGATNIMFYFTGLSSVAGIANNTYAPGAVADHLTSYGGMLTNSSQMSSLRWLEAGATASYGTVIEPYAYPAKFPAASVMTRHYMAGEPIGLAYFKSVQWPAQGIFIGDPLAAPFQGYQYFSDADKVYLNVFAGASSLTGATLSKIGGGVRADGSLPTPAGSTSTDPVVGGINPGTFSTIQYKLKPFTPAKTEFVIPAKEFSFNSIYTFMLNK